MPHAAHQVLVVDDDRDIREALAGIIDEEGWTVETAIDGLDAKDKLDGGLRPCLLILDLRMPRMSGQELLEYMRAGGPDLRELPVIVLTTEHAPAVAGAQGVLRKPFAVGHLISEIERHCSR